MRVVTNPRSGKFVTIKAILPCGYTYGNPGKTESIPSDVPVYDFDAVKAARKKWAEEHPPKPFLLIRITQLLEGNGEMTCAEIATDLGVSRAGVDSALGRLRCAGKLERIKHDDTFRLSPKKELGVRI